MGVEKEKFRDECKRVNMRGHWVKSSSGCDGIKISVFL